MCKDKSTPLLIQVSVEEIASMHSTDEIQ